MPLIPGFEGQYGTSKATALQAITHWNYRSISQGHQSLLARLAKEVGDPHRYLCFFGLRTWSEMNGRLVSEIVYVHSKLAIVDDNRVLIGSANINDRSLVGDRDSEIAVLFEDTEFVRGMMNGQHIQVGKFASNLRKRLFREHLGDFDGTQINYQDPISDSFYKDTWLSTAARNTTMFEKVCFNFSFNFRLIRLFRYLIVFQLIPHLHLLNYAKFNRLQNYAKQILKKLDVYFNRFAVI
jgi:phospholipase D1/2